MTEPPTGSSWYLCEHPERPIDEHARVHHGCDGCTVGYQAAFHRFGARAAAAGASLRAQASIIRQLAPEDRA
jgi:hypothetical protein